MAKTLRNRNKPEPISALPDPNGAAESGMAAVSALEATPARPMWVEQSDVSDDVTSLVLPDPISGDGDETDDTRGTGSTGPAAAVAAVGDKPASNGSALNAAAETNAKALAAGESAANLAAAAEEATGNQDFERAEILWHKYKEINPDEVWAYVGPARLAAARGNFDAAAADLTAAIYLFPNEFAPKGQLADLYLRTNRIREALILWEELDDRFPDNVWVFVGRAWALARLGDIAGASEVLSVARTRLPHEVERLRAVKQEVEVYWSTAKTGVPNNTAKTEAPDDIRGGMGDSRLLRSLWQQPFPEKENEATWARADGGIAPPLVAEARQLGGARSYAPAPAVVGTRILFDISDLIYYIGNHPNLTGIQRVQSGIVLAIMNNKLLPQSNVIFFSFNHKTRNLVSIRTRFLLALLEDLFLPESQRLISFPAEEARFGLLPGAREFDGVGVLDDGNDSVLCLLGAAWVHQDYLHRVLALKRQFGTKFVMTVHDLIPIFAPNTCDQDTVRVFEDFMRPALRHADHILSVSEHTAKDIKRYVESLQIPEPPITVTRNGSSFAEFLPKNGPAGDLKPSELPDRFVLFVATIEGRKNHKLILDVWRRMIEDGDDPPHLVCVGRLGWKSSAFITTLVETGYLNGRVQLLRDISDTDLTMLYRRCLFTVCPTFYEGWGLPVGESLAMGKICVCSDRTSVPEVAGEFGVYIDIDSIEKSWRVIRGLIVDAPARKRLEAKIRRGYEAISWCSVAEKVVAACLAAPNIEWSEPYPYTAIPYCSEISFARLDRHTDGSGEPLLTRIQDMRRGRFLSDSLHQQSFVWGEEARSSGRWSLPEDWGTWSCHAGGEIALGLGPNESRLYYVFLRLRASAPVFDEAVELFANGERVWGDTIGPRSRDIVLRIRRRAVVTNGWRLRIRAQLNLTGELRERLAAVDSRVPTIGFERLIVVPENDLKTRLDVMYSLLL